MASLAFGHLTEPIWLGLLSVALPDLAAAIANLFLLETFSPGVGTIEIWNNWSCGFENSLQRGKGRRISAGCHLLEELGEGGHFKLYNLNLSRGDREGEKHSKTLERGLKSKLKQLAV